MKRKCWSGASAYVLRSKTSISGRIILHSASFEIKSLFGKPLSSKKEKERKEGGRWEIGNEELIFLPKQNCCGFGASTRYSQRLAYKSLVSNMFLCQYMSYQQRSHYLKRAKSNAVQLQSNQLRFCFICFCFKILQNLTSWKCMTHKVPGARFVHRHLNDELCDQFKNACANQVVLLERIFPSGSNN